MAFTATAAQSSPAVTELRLEFGRPGLEVSIDGEPVGSTNAQGRLVVRLEAVDDQALVIEAQNQRFHARVERRIFEAGIPETWFLEGELKPRPAQSTPPPPERRPEPPQPPRTEPPPPQTLDPCAQPSSFACLRQQLQEIETGLKAGECEEALARLDALVFEQGSSPSLDSIQSLASWYLDCGVRQAEPAWVRRAVEVLEQAPTWACHRDRARQLAMAYRALAVVDTSSPSTSFERAVQTFDEARRACAPETRIAAEWQAYFLVELGRKEDALALVRKAELDPDFEAFLRVWSVASSPAASEPVASEPVTSEPVASEPVATSQPVVTRESETAVCDDALRLASLGSGEQVDAPCRALPHEHCQEQVGRTLLRCARQRSDYRRAAAYLAPLTQSDNADPVLLRLVAESSLQGEDFESAARAYERLLAQLEARGVTPPSTDARRFGDAVLLWPAADAALLMAANEAYRRAAAEDVLSTRQQVLLLNNRGVLLLRLAHQEKATQAVSAADTQEALREANVLLERALARVPDVEVAGVESASEEAASEEAVSEEEMERVAWSRLARVLRANHARVQVRLAQLRQDDDPRASYLVMKRAEEQLSELDRELRDQESTQGVLRLGSDFVAVVPAELEPAPEQPLLEEVGP